ncbi:hypothetical protein GCM10018781_04130 [Kitasatospora indigofera]|uniref:SH3 domain-containing protein n=1 Tax=Kitasatospora indigofera TaxID=67307 RepID=A0A919FBX9_9ACTN|nr:SH3 domain-containing protein [Kitasatospora indigofera]GHH59986.1 hypothetical protein GCM10018781_04130 [Kitasatospora indigofera]
MDIQQIADELLDSRDPRIKYVIANRRIATDRAWQWGPYDGANPHDKHVHLSVVADQLCDDPGEWALPLLNGGGGGGGGGAEDGTVEFVTWGQGVNIRQAPSLGAPVVTVLQGPTRVRVGCQTVGDTVTTAGHTNDAWSFVPALGGYISNIFIDHPAAWLPDVGQC